ncbi:MAG TPA: 16S rRNA (guanine(527)-N(7))-methyltransferase RsmG [Stellaceae bacterium]|nr:16S rRNA (guanine(527)-N(7))-methyltransferase RsmG [Stellaceae bacterium]
MSAPLDAAGFAAAANVSRETLARLQAYADLLVQWSPRINLVSAATLGDLWRRHFLDSAQLFPLIPEGTDSLVDLGSGAGFPGLVLAILGVCGVELVESDARKCAFLREAARVSATAVTIRNARIEQVAPHPVSVITARGCAPLERLFIWAQRFAGPETVYLFPKGEQAAQELAAAQTAWTMDVTSHDSCTDPRGVILCVKRLDRRKPAPPRSPS